MVELRPLREKSLDAYSMNTFGLKERKKNEKDYQFKTQYTYYLSNNGHSKGQLITE